MLTGKEQRVVNYIRTHGSINTLEANQDLGDTRLSATIFNLKKKGFVISNPRITVFNRFGEETSVCCYQILQSPANSNEQKEEVA